VKTEWLEQHNAVMISSAPEATLIHLGDLMEHGTDVSTGFDFHSGKTVFCVFGMHLITPHLKR